MAEFSGAVGTCLKIIFRIVGRLPPGHWDVGGRRGDILQVLGPRLGDVKHLPLGGADLESTTSGCMHEKG